MTPGIIVGAILFLFFLIIVGSGMFTVQQQTHAVVERFGRFPQDFAAGAELQMADLREHRRPGGAPPAGIGDQS